MNCTIYEFLTIFCDLFIATQMRHVWVFVTILKNSTFYCCNYIDKFIEFLRLLCSGTTIKTY